MMVTVDRDNTYTLAEICGEISSHCKEEQIFNGYCRKFLYDVSRFLRRGYNLTYKQQEFLEILINDYCEIVGKEVKNMQAEELLF